MGKWLNEVEREAARARVLTWEGAATRWFQYGSPTGIVRDTDYAARLLTEHPEWVKYG